MRFFKHIAILTLSIFLAVLVSHAAAPILQYGVLPWNTANTAIDTATITVGQMTSSAILVGTPTAGASYTTPSATALCAQFPFLGNGANNRWSYDWYVKNTSLGSNTITMLAGSGVTVVGTATAAQNTVRHFRVVFTSCTTPAVQLLSLETASF